MKTQSRLNNVDINDSYQNLCAYFLNKVFNLLSMPSTPSPVS